MSAERQREVGEHLAEQLPRLDEIAELKRECAWLEQERDQLLLDRDATPSPCTDPIRAALLAASAEVYAYLRKEYAPPIWIHVIDILQSRAGSVWLDGEDIAGAYLCPCCSEQCETGPCSAGAALGALPVGEQE